MAVFHPLSDYRFTALPSWYNGNLSNMVNTDDRADDPDFQLIDESGPDVVVLARSYKETVEDLESHIDQVEENQDTRYCVWDGQSADQRKHAVKKGDTQPFPWDGASDLRVPVVDEIITHDVAQALVALSSANIRAVAVEGGDLGKAAVVSNFMRWLMLSQMKELPRESEILANYIHERGIGVLGIFWEQRVQKTQQPISLAEIEATNPDVAVAIRENLFSEELATMVAQQFGVSAKKAKRMLKDLRDTGTATVPYVVQQVNRPVVRAYAVGEDVFFPANTQDFQAARSVFRRQYLAPEAAREKVISDGWDSDYVEQAIAKCMAADGTGTSADESFERRDELVANKIERHRGLVEFVWAYQRLSDEDGVPGIYCTVLCPAMHEDDGDGSYAKHELLGYRHGLYPFVVFNREHLSRLLLDTRGTPETNKGFQDAIKTEYDARRDNASLATVPPVRHPVGRAPGRLGPGTMIAERRPQEYGYMEIPPPPQASVEIQTRIEQMTRKYNGRPTADDAQNEWQTKAKKQINSWLLGWKEVMAQTWELWSQYGPDEEWFRVIGAGTTTAQKFSKSEFSGKYDFWVNVGDVFSDAETFQAKLKAIGEIAQQFDRNGQVDYGRLLIRSLEMIDPILAEDVVVPTDVAAQKEVTETQSDLSKLWAGIDLDVPQQGINPQLRLQVMQQWLQGPQDNPAVDVQARLAADPALQKRVQRYTEQLQFQITQRENALIGRIGTAPAGTTGQ